jgi:lysozyme
MAYKIRKTRVLLVAIFVVILVFYCLSTCKNHAFGISIPAGYSIHGIDVSRYQGKIDWNYLENIVEGNKKIKITFAIIKATEGRSLKDPMFDTNWKNIGRTGLIKGAYHYFIPSRNPLEQAKNFIATVELKKGDLPPVLDVEVAGKQGIEKLKENIKIWLREIEKYYGVKPVIYSYIDFYEKYLMNDPELKNYPLWIAHYHKSKIKFNTQWLFWQHSDKGKITGIKEYVDFNVFNGSLKELKALCKK